MMFISLRLLQRLLCLFALCIPFKGLYAESQARTHYLLPEHHPLHRQLTSLLHAPHLFRSPEHLQKAGFQIKLGNRKTKLMVIAHPLLPQHFIKKFPDGIAQKAQLSNFIKRIKGANLLRNCIKKHQFKHLVVPQKWLYRLPKDFPPHSYALIVEKMDIYDDWDNPQGEARRLYYNMDLEVLTELCLLLHEVGGYDSLPRNLPFTHAGQIAFIDTEFVGTAKNKEQFHRDTLPALNPKLQAYALALWEKLEEEKTTQSAPCK